jgi:pimeloyl-ACP methyl ester carboxylesterase
MAFDIRGKGDPVLLIHGYPLNRTMWQAQVEALSSRYLVIVPDLRGHRGSDAPAGDYTMDLLADDLVALLNLAVVSGAVMVGFSMGGAICIAMERR